MNLYKVTAQIYGKDGLYTFYMSNKILDVDEIKTSVINFINNDMKISVMQFNNDLVSVCSCDLMAPNSKKSRTYYAYRRFDPHLSFDDVNLYHMTYDGDQQSNIDIYLPVGPNNGSSYSILYSDVIKRIQLEYNLNPQFESAVLTNFCKLAPFYTTPTFFIPFYEV